MAVRGIAVSGTQLRVPGLGRQKRLAAVVIAAAEGYILAYGESGRQLSVRRYGDGARDIAEGRLLPSWISCLNTLQGAVGCVGAGFKRATSNEMARPVLFTDKGVISALLCRGHHAVRAGGASSKHPTKSRNPFLPVRSEPVLIRRPLPSPPKRYQDVHIRPRIHHAGR